MNADDVEFAFDSYSLLEEKLLNILKLIPLSSLNEGTWSPELVGIFVETGNLVDSISRVLLGGSQNLDIKSYESDLFTPMDILNSNIIVYKYPLRVIKPFNSYRRTGHGWWYVYNKLKHNLMNHYERANLINVTKALGGLFLILSRYRSEDFTKALIRREWSASNWVPEYVHSMRVTENLFWVDSELFGTCDAYQNIPDDLTQINPIFASPKFQRHIGRLN
ncbi:MAG: hypothetical protein KBD24_00950 [Candidatus Pacebacteria bacterium]|nr:hypothetical protein [Candidatus Paceibacterota bacterium]